MNVPVQYTLRVQFGSVIQGNIHEHAHFKHVMKSECIELGDSGLLKPTSEFSPYKLHPMPTLPEMRGIYTKPRIARPAMF